MNEEPYSVLVEAETFKKLVRYAEKSHQDVPKAIHCLVSVAMPEHKEGQSIEYEQITIQVPKQVMELLRFTEKSDGEAPKDYIERGILDHLRADIDAEALISHEAIADKFLLKPIFEELLGSC